MSGRLYEIGLKIQCIIRSEKRKLFTGMYICLFSRITTFIGLFTTAVQTIFGYKKVYPDVSFKKSVL
jgi:hypothetical protein